MWKVEQMTDEAKKTEKTTDTAGAQDGNGQPLAKYLETPYVKGIIEDKLIYSNRFYYDMYQLLMEGKTAEQAYTELGFDVGVLGTNRASCAARRAKEKARNNKLKTDDEPEDMSEDNNPAGKETSADIDPEIARLVEENPYIKSFSNGRFKYYDEIYPAVKALLDKGMSASAAFEELGIPVSVVGQDRAAAVAKRARSEEYAKRSIYNPGGYNGSISLEEILKMAAGMPLLMLVSQLIARIIYLEGVLEELKKKEVNFFGSKTVYKINTIKLNMNHLVDWGLSAYKGLLGIDQAGFLKIFGVNRSTYESYKNHTDKLSENQQRNLVLRLKVGKAIREILKKHNGNVPGKRRMRMMIIREYGIQASEKLVASVMREMGLSGTVKRKDAYKGQATHNHPCSAKANNLRRDFFKGVGAVILTDISYLYYGKDRKLIYLCVFRDAFTMETLGWSVGKRMNQKLVNDAYKMMREELKRRGIDPKSSVVFVHSDQGSQYTSTTFEQLLHDDDFVQSVSRRGNSQDNAPVESFFGTFKQYTIAQLALAPDYETAVTMVENAIKYFNEELISESLGWLTPHEFYLYAVTGVYPADNYFGLKENQLLPLEDLAKGRKEQAAKNAERQRRYYNAKKGKKAAADSTDSGEDADYLNMVDDILKKDPRRVIEHDLKIADKDLKAKEKMAEKAEEKRDLAKKLKEKIQAAMEWAGKVGPEVIEDLKNRQNWKKYSQLSYINEMDGMYP